MGNGEVDVAPDSLLAQAREWDSDAEAVGGMSAEVQGLRFDGFAGFFSVAVDPYNQLCQQWSAKCAQGDTQMKKIAAALVEAHKKYAVTERYLSGEAAGISQQATP